MPYFYIFGKGCNWFIWNCDVPGGFGPDEGAVLNTYDKVSYDGGVINFTDPSYVSLAATSQGQINGSNTYFVLANAMADGTFVVGAYDNSLIFMRGCTFTGTAVGPRYTVTGNATINTNGGGPNFFPGDAAGIASDGGVYVGVITPDPTFTVATLPTPAANTRAMVSDALAPSFGVAVVGGGTVTTPVYADGSTWNVG